jgi:hypothetical protein
MEIADYRNEPNYDGWASMDSWPLKCGIDLIAAHMSEQMKSSSQEFDNYFEDNKNILTRIVTLGINNGNLCCVKYDWIFPEVEESVFSSINTIVDKSDFLRFIKDRGFPVHRTLWESVRPEEAKEPKLRSEQETKLICQGIAIALWNMNPDMTITDMANQELLLTKGGGKMYSEKTRRGWVSDVDTRPEEKKTGPKRQQ